MVGIIGAFVGGVLFGATGLQATGLVGEIVTSTVGAIAFLSARAGIKTQEAVRVRLFL